MLTLYNTRIIIWNMEVIKINKQNEANKRWQQKNKEHANYLKDRSKARSFIKNKATGEDLEELKELIITRSKELKEV